MPNGRMGARRAVRQSPVILVADEKKVLTGTGQVCIMYLCEAGCFHIGDGLNVRIGPAPIEQVGVLCRFFGRAFLACR